MGAEQFGVRSKGLCAAEAFRRAVNQARFDYGHRGYTGTIAEKQVFVVIQVPEGKDPKDYAKELLREGDPRISDKWGPAGAVRLSGNEDEEEWLFFGWASS